MARSRNIKPGFFTNDELAECDPLARLLFAGLWTEADREGRLEDRPKKIKAAILPYDSCDADELLNQLATRGFILRYQAGAAYIQITCFGKHQDPHYKEKASDIPAPPGHADTGKTAGAPSDELRAEIIARDGACVHCSSTSDLTLDHIIPRSKGGTHEKDNLQTLCRRCNSAKNNREARPIIGRSSANDPGGKSPLIPDSGFLIPDSLPLIPDSKEKAKTARARATPCPEGVTEGTWTDWLTLRKAKRAPVTDTVVREASIEAGKAGLSLDAFLRVWCARGSQGLQAEWLKPAERGKPETISKYIRGTSLDPDFQGYHDEIGPHHAHAPALR